MEQLSKIWETKYKEKNEDIEELGKGYRNIADDKPDGSDDDLEVNENNHGIQSTVMDVSNSNPRQENEKIKARQNAIDDVGNAIQDVQ